MGTSNLVPQLDTPKISYKRGKKTSPSSENVQHSPTRNEKYCFIGLTVFLSSYTVILFRRIQCAVLNPGLNLEKSFFIFLLSVFSQHPLLLGGISWYLSFFPNLFTNSTNVY